MKSFRRRLWLGLGLAVLAWPPLAWLAAAALAVPDEAPARADAIVVLSGSSTYAERASLAAQLYREGRAPRVLLTNDGEPGGWSAERDRTVYFVERAADALRGAGVPGSAVETLPEPVANTFEEAQRVRAYAKHAGLHTLIVVTSAYHSRRALWTWRRVLEGSGLTFGLRTVPPGEQTAPLSLWWLSRRGWQDVAGEYVKLAYYRLGRA
jgi:uncharacterized SAM-binding protein YcdF (DUF218 family)